MIINAVQTGFLKDIPQQPESLSSLFKEVTKKNINIYCQSVATEMSKSLHENIYISKPGTSAQIYIPSI